MSTKCQVCSSPHKEAIEEAIISDTADTDIQEMYGIDSQAIRRHRINHLPDKLALAAKHQEIQHGTKMFRNLDELLDISKNILYEAREDKKHRIALKAIKESRSTIELLARIVNQLEKYRRQDEQQNKAEAEQEAMQGLEALSDKELIVFQALQAKIIKADSNNLLNPEAQRYIDSISVDVAHNHENRQAHASNNNKKTGGTDKAPNNSNESDSIYDAPYNLDNYKNSKIEPDSDSKRRKPRKRRTKNVKSKTTLKQKLGKAKPNKDDFADLDLDFPTFDLDDIDATPKTDEEKEKEKGYSNEPWAD